MLTAPMKYRELEAGPHQYEPSASLGVAAQVTHAALGATSLYQGQRDKNHLRNKQQNTGLSGIHSQLHANA